MTPVVLSKCLLLLVLLLTQGHGNLDDTWAMIWTDMFPKLRLPEAPKEGAEADTS